MVQQIGAITLSLFFSPCQIAFLYQLKARKFDTYHSHMFVTLIGLVGTIPSCE